MKLLSVNSLCGGNGATTVVANLASAMELLGCRTLSVDLNIANALMLHYGIDPHFAGGWAASLVAGGQLGEAVWQSDDGRRVLPLGALSGEVLPQLEVKGRGAALTLFGKALAGIDVLIVDAPSGAPALWNDALGQIAGEALSASALHLQVLGADPRSYAALHRLPLSPDSVLLINGHQPERAVFADMALAIHYEFDGRIAPVALSNDMAAPEAAACQQSVLQYAPAGQLTADFRALALWCRARVGLA